MIRKSSWKQELFFLAAANALGIGAASFASHAGTGFGGRGRELGAGIWERENCRDVAYYTDEK